MNDVQPLVGICIPVYEHPDLLKRAIESILKQNYKNYIVVITDDSVSDVIKKYIYSLSIDKIYYYRNKKRLGASENSSESIKKAYDLKVELIKLLYQDDYFFDEESLVKIVKEQQNSGADIVFTGYYETNGENQKSVVCSKNIIKEVCQDPTILFRGNLIGVPSLFLFKPCDTYFNPKYSWYLDIEFYIRLFKGRKISYIYEPLMVIGHDGDQLTDHFYRHPIKMWLETVKLFFDMKELHNVRNFIHIFKYAKVCISIYRKYKN